MKIIHIVENLNKGAVENWLVNVFIESRKIKPGWHWTFYCILGQEGRLDKIVREAGGEIIYSPFTISNKWNFLKALRITLKSGNYDIIHSHHDYLSGFYLLASRGIHFKKRILHIHNTDAALPVGSRLLQKILLKPFRWLGFHFSDLIVGISTDALQQFVKTKSFTKKQAVVLYYGIDMNKFEAAIDPAALRTELNIDQDCRLLLFCGRMNEFKNPVFVVDILNELIKNGNNYHAIFIGEGDLTAAVKEKAIQYGLIDKVHLLGWRNDLAALMKSSDVFVFPRVEFPKEGLGLIVVEAQAAGLPMVLSNGILPEAIAIPELANFISLNNNSKEWADKIDSIKKTATPELALKKMKSSKFALPVATQNLIGLYEC